MEGDPSEPQMDPAEEENLRLIHQSLRLIHQNLQRGTTVQSSGTLRDLGWSYLARRSLL